MDQVLHDLKYSLRTLRRSPGFVAVAILSLALGIGANTAIFSVVDTVLLRQLPYADPDRLVMIWEDASYIGFPRNTPAPANYADWKAQNDVFTDVAAISSRSFNLTGNGDPERVVGYRVTGNFFSLLGVQPAIGRTFLPEEDQPGTNRVVVLSHALWQNSYGGESNILGRKILLTGEPYTVVGVMPAGFQFRTPEIRLWVPIGFTPEQLARRGSHYLTVIARLKPGISLAQANEEVMAITKRVNPQQSRLGSLVLPIREELTGDISRPLLLVMVAVGMVLLIACANLAGLQLSRANARRREIALRAALGSGRARILRQLITESVLLSLTGGVTGIFLAYLSFSFLRQLIPPGLVQSAVLTMNLKTLFFTLTVSVLAGLLFGIAPAWQASKSNLSDALKQGDLRAGAGVRGNRIRNVMVVVEVALALVLLVGTGLMIRTVSAMYSQYAGFKPESLLALRTQLSAARYEGQEARTAFYDQVLERVRALPGVTSAAYTTSLPLDWKGGTLGFYPEGGEIPGLSYDANCRLVTPGYFKTVGIALRDGRAFDDRDGSPTTMVAIVNETMARQYWPGQNALGRRFKLDIDSLDKVPWLTIVGVVADIRQMGMTEPVKAEMYFPHRQANNYYDPRDLVIRTSAADPMSLVPSIREQVHAVDPNQPVSGIRTYATLLDSESAPRRLAMTLLSAFAALAMLLAAVGIYGVLAYFVSQHTQEIGVRLALGAQPADVLLLVLGKGMTLVSMGVVTGICGALALTRLITGLLYGVSPTDPATYVPLLGTVFLFGLLACYLPARRASRVDPMQALRYE